MDTESVTTAKPHIDHSNLKAHILFLTKVFHTTSLKFSELNSGTYSLDSYTSPDETHPGSDMADKYTLTHSN